MNLKNILIFLVIIIIVLGSTEGDASAAAVGRGVGEALHLIGVAWDAMMEARG